MSFLCNSSPEMRACCTISTCLCRMHSQPEHLVNFILFFSPFIYQLHFFFPSIFFPSFFFINYRRSHFSFGSLCECLFWMEYTGKVQSPHLFSQLFFPTKPQSTFHFLKHRSLCLWSYILMTRSSDLQTRAIFFFFLIPTPYSIWLQNLWSREKWIPLLINQPSLFISSSLELVLKVVVWCIHKYL